MNLCNWHARCQTAWEVPKPSTVFVWATDAAYGASANPWSTDPNKVAPVAGLIAEGWEPTEHPAADNLNWNFNLIGQWIDYIDAGVWDGDLEIDGRLHVNPTSPTAFPQFEVSNGTTLLEATTVVGTFTLTGSMVASGDVTAADYNHTTEFRATLPLVHNAASQNVGNTVNVPHKITSNGIPFYFESGGLGIIGLREGDVVTKVRVRYSGNAGLTLVSVNVKHYRHDTGEATTANSSSTASGHIEVVPGAGKNKIEIHDTMLDVIWVQVSGSATGITIEGIDVFWTHPA